MSPAEDAVERVVRVVGDEMRGAFVAGAVDMKELRKGLRRALRGLAAELGVGAASTAGDERQTDWLTAVRATGVEGVVSE